MNFFKRIKKWMWFDIIIAVAIIVADNTLRGEGMWLSVVLAGIAAVTALLGEHRYKYDYPVNHPDQNLDERDILGNLVLCILSVFMCVAPLAFGNSWTTSLAVLVGLTCVYATWISSDLYFATKKHVKYVG